MNKRVTLLATRCCFIDLKKSFKNFHKTPSHCSLVRNIQRNNTTKHYNFTKHYHTQNDASSLHVIHHYKIFVHHIHEGHITSYTIRVGIW